MPLQLSALDENRAGAIHLDSVGLAHVDGAQRELVEALLEQLLPAIDASLGCTKWAEHDIETVSAQPIQ